jgi:alkylation response protein AidB-like acyl-CoA dehydrogenase|tara:strand:- start:1362 stop:2546 length:1185 start_codon:yes stop_codon:yes gene_type:complete
MENFRQEVRQWLDQHCPESMRNSGSDDETVWGGRNATYPNPESKAWLDAMGSKGWTCPTWPKNYGGGGLSFDENKILQSELERVNARPALTSFGISMLGPVLLEYGNEEQKLEHLPKIVRGEIRWCQGYSEPGSGSDLASLQTRAVADGDEYVINGSKVWTSYANFADWIFCLVRTDASAPKHEGISFVLFDMTSRGIRTKPIQLISGESPFCETFFDDVRIPRPNLVGKENQGWTIAKQLLQHERNMVAGMGTRGKTKKPANKIENQAKQYFGEIDGKIASASLRDDIARHQMNGIAFALTVRRTADEAKTTSAPSPTSSMFKYYGTEQNKNRFEILMNIMGSQSLGWEGDSFNPRELSTSREWLRSKANSIEGGTSEVQLNIIAKRVLGLPD